MTIEQMREIKENRGYSFAQLSEYTGVPAITLQKIFGGITKNPRKATLNAIEKVLSAKEELYRGKAYEYDLAGYNNVIKGGDPKYLREDPVVYGAEQLKDSNPDGIKYGNPSKKQGEFTLDDYYALPEEQRVELIDGVFYDMGAPNLAHQDVSYVIHSAIANYIRKNNGKCRAFSAPVDVQIDCDNKTMVQPDVLVVCDRSKLKTFGVLGAPDLLVEILSPSTRKKDMTIKLSKYQEAGVREYWIVDPRKKVLITYNFMDEEFVPVITPLKGEFPVAIFDDKLKINLDEIAQSIEEFG